jgi:AraC-like DNA-binding protein
MDALSDVLRFVRLTGGVFLDAEFSAPWCVKSQIGPDDCAPFLPEVAHIISYHYVVDGQLVVQIGAEAPVTLNAGDVVLLPRNDVHYLGSAIDRNPINARELIQPPDDGGLPRIVHGGGGTQTRIVCGFLGSEVQSGPLLATLPPMLTMNVAGTPGGEWIMQSFTFASREIARSEPGAATVLSKMSELLFVEAVRRYLATLPSEETGWLAGLRDPVVGRALALLHTGPAQAWTAEMLSRAVGLSRSAFADRFTGLIGQPPMHYLTAWRMQVAAHKLRAETGSIAQIAFEVGYESEAAFTRAFKRHFGAPPSSWRAKKTGTVAARPAGALPAALQIPRE